MGDIQLINRSTARQYGCFNVGQACLARFDRRAVARRIGNGSWIRMCPGVYAVASSPPSWERKLSAAVLSRPRAIVGGAAAARLHGLSGFARARPVIVIPWSGNARSPISRVIRSSFFNTPETVRVRGFRATKVAETLLALAADLPLARLEAVLEEGLLTGRVRLRSSTRYSIVSLAPGSEGRVG